MKSKLIFFVIITLFIALKKGYLYLCEVQGLDISTKLIPVNDSVFDSLEVFNLYKKQVFQILKKIILKLVTSNY